MFIRLREPAEEGRQPYLSYLRRGLYVGSALAALGLLTLSCSWDDDTRYFPRPIGTYLRVDTQLWWFAENGALAKLPYSVRAIAGTEKHLLALSTQGSTLYIFPGGQTDTQLSVQLLYPMHTLHVGRSPEIVYLGGYSHLGTGSVEVVSGKTVLFQVAYSLLFGFGPHLIASAPAFAVVAAREQLFVVEERKNLLTAGVVWRGQLPGPVVTLWIEHPTSAAGLFRWRDSLYAFRYTHTARLLQVDTTQPASFRERATSPYLKSSFGTEYLGSVSLSMDYQLRPGAFSGVQDWAADFFGGKGYFLRRDTVWRYALREPSILQAVGVFPGASEIEIVPVYLYGSAEITMR